MGVLGVGERIGDVCGTCSSRSRRSSRRSSRCVYRLLRYTTGDQSAPPRALKCTPISTRTNPWPCTVHVHSPLSSLPRVPTSSRRASSCPDHPDHTNIVRNLHSPPPAPCPGARTFPRPYNWARLVCRRRTARRGRRRRLRSRRHHRHHRRHRRRRRASAKGVSARWTAARWTRAARPHPRRSPTRGGFP